MPTVKTVTFDSTTQPGDAIVSFAEKAGWQVAFASVTYRENQDPAVKLALNNHETLPELAVWDESSWDQARWADEGSGTRLDQILAIISSRSFPKDRTNLTEKQQHQLRDAMVLEAHTAYEREVLVSDDLKAFINHQRREKLEALLHTRILTRLEFHGELTRVAGTS
jgi:hypothetical protein